MSWFKVIAKNIIKFAVLYFIYLLRFLFDCSAAIIGPKEYPNLAIKNLNIGDSITVRIYTPKLDHVAPIIIFFHGGGWIIGSVKAYDRILQYLAFNTGFIVVGVNYRKAPEYGPIEAFQDARKAYLWVYDNAESIKGDRTKISIIGDSAGGNIAIQLVHDLDKNRQPIKALGLIYPVIIDKTKICNDINHKSIIGVGHIVLKHLIKYYFGSINAAENAFKTSDLLCVKIYPNIIIIAAESDPLTEIIKDYVIKLKNKGAAIEYHYYQGTVHGFMNFFRFSPSAKKALDDLVCFFKKI